MPRHQIGQGKGKENGGGRGHGQSGHGRSFLWYFHVRRDLSEVRRGQEDDREKGHS